ncbi:MAG: DNA-directed RNA polymerase subunit P [Thermoplasmata archaeon]|nr:MAG: DNA-directed RNA polymerase subunit P [Thermoplasmata archaeon]HDO69454.1 DNA-directed RNA polymerase subunit P [Thermoplasmatales archaeon]HEX17369.1 DNA-directed RNA polymerase subunit P [Thermoplasmatales archaeon]
MRMVEYRCGNCKKKVDLNVESIGLQCPYCGSKIFYKERPPIAKRVKAR